MCEWVWRRSDLYVAARRSGGGREILLRRRTWSPVLLGLAPCVFFLATTTSAQDEPTIGTQVGQMYPDYLLPKVGGGWGRLSDFRGKKTVLLHFASW